MSWILVWWIIHTHYMEIHTQPGFVSSTACVEAGKALVAPPNTRMHFHCGMQ